MFARRGKTTLKSILLASALGLAALPALAQSTDAAGAAGLLARANAAFAAERMVAPAGDNALEWTLAAREVEPDSTRVREGLNDLYPLVVAAIEREIRADRYNEALRVIDLLDRAIPNSLAARELRAKVARRSGAVTSAAGSARVASLDLPG